MWKPNTWCLLQFLAVILLVVGTCPKSFAQADWTKLEINEMKHQVMIHRPDRVGPWPLLIITGAKHHDVRSDFFHEIAKRARRLGYFTVRIPYGFQLRSQEPSKDLSRENEEILQVIRYYGARPYINSDRITLLSKSFGTRIIMKGAHELVNRLILITPNCKQKTFMENYAKLRNDARPIHIVISRQDPHCDFRQITRSLEHFGGATTFNLVEGDHDFLLESKSPTISRLNQIAVIQRISNFLLIYK